MSQQLHWCGQVPTTTPGTVPFQMTATGAGPVDLGKAGLDFGVDYFWFTHSFNPALQIQQQNKKREKKILNTNLFF